MRTWLHHKHVRAAHVFLNLVPLFPVAELAAFRAPARHAQERADCIRQVRVRAAAENFEFLVHQCGIPLKHPHANADAGGSLPS